MQGQLFSEYFINEGIRTTEEWEDTVKFGNEFAEFEDAVRKPARAILDVRNPSEAITEQDLIEPVLKALAWQHYVPQQGTERNQNIPDLLLFADADSKNRALAAELPRDRYRLATVVQENKRWGLELSSRDHDDKVQPASPHGQILRYLSDADIESDGAVRFGILTNGNTWRLYDHRSRPRATSFFEINLRRALDAIKTNGDYTYLKTFYLLFRRSAFVRSEGATSTFIERCLADAKLFEERVAQDISSTVFERVFPNLVDSIARNATVSLAQARRPALILLYRILFLLFAEDRGLLPVEHPGYQPYGLRSRYRNNLSVEWKHQSSNRCNAYLHFRELCRVVDAGDTDIGVPAYNGNLFSEGYAELLDQYEIPDTEFMPVLQDLSHVEINGEMRYINYRDMSVQQLGSIYERLLEREPVRDDDGNVKIVLNRFARRDSGSYYTPQELVDLIVDQTLSPLIEEKLRHFETVAQKLASDQRSTAERIAELRIHDPAVAVLDLKILDPAMGSGHFLVAAVDFLADYIAQLIEYIPAIPDWSDAAYESPVAKQIRDIRSSILQRASRYNWEVQENQLTDQAIIRRIVLKRCIYGVDKNPLTVELAKVALWLHSFTVGAPLSFLDHHLRCGDALVGISTRHATKELYRLGGIFAQSAVESAQSAANAMQRIEDLPDAEMDEVRKSETLFKKVESNTAELRGILDFVSGLNWLTADMKKTERAKFEAPIVDTLEQSTNGAEKLLTACEPAQPPNQSKRALRNIDKFNERRETIRNVAATENFVHWEPAFPGVWSCWQEEERSGGFDAIIGNPPWDRIKVQEKEWLETRAPQLASLNRAADRWNELQHLRDAGSDLLHELDEAKGRANQFTAWARNHDLYPLLSGGDVNLYSLFVERALTLINPRGIVGLLTPSGIYGDAAAARFFRAVSTGGRIHRLYDFVNRKQFFKDVHSSFKFSVFIFGGRDRHFNESKCGFFLQNVQQTADPERVFPVLPRDFAKVNPNSGTAPVFRNHRDASLTFEIYRRIPVLADHANNQTGPTWPVEHRTMFHPGKDSELFSTAEHLYQAGFYPVKYSRWKKGFTIALPLYEGKMVQAYNHRAASAVNREGIVYRPGQSLPSNGQQLADPKFTNTPRFWVESDASDTLQDYTWFLAFKDVTASTNRRTVIATILPKVASTGTLRLLIGSDQSFNAQTAALILANLNSFALDYVARQKIHGTHVAWYAVEQLPVLPLKDYDISIGDTTASELVRDHVLRLTYTAHDIQAFALDIGYLGEPFTWDDNERIHLRARLDALYFMLYGISRDDADYILSTFPIVQREDETQHGRFVTRDLILAYMNSLEAGDTETIVNL